MTNSTTRRTFLKTAAALAGTSPIAANFVGAAAVASLSFVSPASAQASVEPKDGAAAAGGNDIVVTAQKIEQVEIYIPPGPRLGDVVVEARGLRKAYGDQLLIDDLNFTLPRGGIVGVIGPNGAGKTTMMDVITGKTRADSGTAFFGQTIDLKQYSEVEIAQAGTLLQQGQRCLGKGAYGPQHVAP